MRKETRARFFFLGLEHDSAAPQILEPSWSPARITGGLSKTGASSAGAATTVVGMPSTRKYLVSIPSVHSQPGDAIAAGVIANE